ncbi:MAG: ABC transporter permease [Rhizobiaceae bacterium]|nr:ABC transporter permease [Rhizobiaceae bacterium]
MSATSSTATPFGRLALAWRFSLREMRGGLSGFRVFLACIAIGVAAIAAVNGVGRSITTAIEREGASILGGDIRFELNQREATADERVFLDGLGRVTHTAGLRSMALRADEADQALVELKAVDAAWPLYGALGTEPALDRAALFAQSGEYFGAVAPQALFDRLGLAVGERLKLGNAEVELRAVLTNEPDLASDGFGFAPRLLTSMEALAATGLVQPGSLVEHGYKVALSPDANPANVRADAETRFPEAGWGIRTRDNASPALSNNVERFTQFLTLVGLSALAVGGVGVANAVRAYLDGKRGVIATLKCLGGSGGFVFTVYMVQILMLGALGIAIGLALGAVAPTLAAFALQGVFPVALEETFFVAPLALAALFGVLCVLLFAILPLGQARDVPATALFRGDVLGTAKRGIRPVYIAAAAAFGVMIAALAVLTSDDRRIALTFLGGLAFAFIVLRGVAWGVAAVAKRAPHARHVPLRLAVANIHRPGALTASVVLSLGLGLTLLASIALIDGSLRAQISGQLPERAPNFFFVDIRSSEVDAFAATVAELAPSGKLVQVPMLRGRITAINGQDPSTMDVPPGGRWVLRGDRGITYAKTLPENSRLSAGAWWPADHSGKPLVSFAAEEAAELGLKLGDTVTVNVLGREITAEISNFREVAWESLSINFVMVFSPNTFAGAPHSWLATLVDSEADATKEAQILNTLARTYPNITTVRVKDALDVVNRVIGQLGTAIRVAAGVALVASVLVLAGALAAGNRARQRDAVILKTLGATRRTLMGAYALEYGLIGLATAVFALAAGYAAAWYVIDRIMTLETRFDAGTVTLTVLIALVVTVGFGLAGTWRILGARAAPALREA